MSTMVPFALLLNYKIFKPTKYLEIPIVIKILNG